MENNIKTRKQLLESIETLTDEQLNKKLSIEQWSIIQVLEHLYLMEAKLVKLMTRVLAEGESHSVSDKPIHLALDRSQKFNSPKHFEPSDQFLTKQEMLDKLSQSRKALIEFVEQTKGLNLEGKGFLHPIFGQINIKQWIPFIGIHEQRHSEQIAEIKKQLLKEA